MTTQSELQALIDDLDGVEEWKPIAGHESRYAISSHGRVWSHLSDKYLRPQRHTNEYLFVILYRPYRSADIHRLVAKAFLPNPRECPQVNHIDVDRQNNKSENLEWVTATENVRHSIKFGSVRLPDGTARASLFTAEQVVEMREKYADGGVTQKQLAMSYGVTRSAIACITRGRTYKSVGGPITDGRKARLTELEAQEATS